MKLLNFFNLRKSNLERGVEWRGTSGSPLPTGKIQSVLFASNELGGETGELQNKIKKFARLIFCMPGSGNLTYEEHKRGIEDELADVVICADLLAIQFGIDLGEVVARKFNETSDKHGFESKIDLEEPEVTDATEVVVETMAMNRASLDIAVDLSNGRRFSVTRDREIIELSETPGSWEEK